MAPHQIRRVARQAGGPQLKDGFHLVKGELQLRQRIQAIQQQGLQLRRGIILLREYLCHLGKIAGQC